MAGIVRFLRPQYVRRLRGYIRKNGWKDGVCAVIERMLEKRKEQYTWQPLSEAALRAQREEAERLHERLPLRFSILVPAYETDGRYLREMIGSVLAQTWPWLELIVADASETDAVGRIVRETKDGRLRYLRLPENRGISENSNAALDAATGDYTGLLDHDDLLTPDALYEMARAIEAGGRDGERPRMLYSDEDKVDGSGRHFSTPHYKPDFNYDLLLSNNYVCHFLVLETELLRQTRFRALYDGSQDYDLTLRALRRCGRVPVHVGRVLYHWRAHARSTSENPESKLYAYEAGRKAVNDYCADIGLRVRLKHARHLGFYRVEYEPDVLRQRREVGAVGGRLLCRGKVCGGAYEADGSVRYAGLPACFSGYMHRAEMQQDAPALDIRFLRIRREAAPCLQEAFRACGAPPLTQEQLAFLQSPLSEDGQAAFVRGLREAGCSGETLRRVSLRFGELLRERGFLLLYDPEKAWRL